MTMKIFHSLVIMILIGCFELSITESKKKLTTVFLSVVFRHGDRAPDMKDGESYPTDPHKNHNFDPAGDGGLTNAGKKREYDLGVKLRHEYKDFLGDIYKPKMVMGRSTNYDRTKMSLMLVLCGLFPTKGKQKWNPHLNWQPIPTKYFPAERDILMAADLCPQYKKELKKVKRSEAIKREYEVFYDLMQNLSNWTGSKIKTSRDMFNLYHTLMAESSMNLLLPTWTNSIFPKGPLFNATIFDYRLRSYNVKLRKLYGGMLLRNIIDTMENIIASRITERKINLFSGHETNVASFLLTLGVYESHVPEYSSGVIVELLKDECDSYYVKVRHYLGIPSKIVDVKIEGCDVICPIKKFKHLLKHVIPSDDDMYCPHHKPMRGF
ncbi:hypothetical protein PV327_000777 [Microctonus hyperodae]|uniref:acid phosphatase n=1 Tax=Microctonus hyperodae TaxID=165561 RepID=A0AA39L2H8_MICHY|nr:hypothetical protein PV327_000777 [Microctonus hyperodae]